MSNPEKMIVHCEADIDSSLIDITIENANAVQLLALGQMIHANGMAALAGQMAQASAEQKPSPIHIMHGSLPQ